MRERSARESRASQVKKKMARKQTASGISGRVRTRHTVRNAARTPLHSTSPTFFMPLAKRRSPMVEAVTANRTPAISFQVLTTRRFGPQGGDPAQGVVIMKGEDSEMAESEELIEFPCDFPVKAMGFATPDFEDHVVGVVSRHASLATPRQVKIKESSGGRYLSVTVTVQARSREHLELIYSDLKSDSRVVFIL